MPLLEINQRLNYESSRFERILKKACNEYCILLPQPVLLGKELEDIGEGIIREITKGSRALCYQKFFKDEKEFLKQYNPASAGRTHINEAKLLDILNSNRLHSEEVKIFDGPTGIALIHYPLNRKYKIDFSEEKGIGLFMRIVNNSYNNHCLDHNQLQNELHYYLAGTRSTEINLDVISKIFRRSIQNRFSPNLENYIDMSVKYIAK